MTHTLATFAAALLLLGSPAPAGAAVIWQQTFAPDPSGQTNLNLDIGFPVKAPATLARLTVQDGTIADIGWTSLSFYTFYFWQNDASTGDQWVLEQDVLPGGPPQVVETVTTTPAFSTYRIDTNSVFDCYGSGFHVFGVCGSVFQHGDASLQGVLVNAGQPFTLTLYGVPEPATWAMMLGGFGLLGLALRARRRPPALAGS